MKIKIKYLAVGFITFGCLGFSSLYASTNDYHNNMYKDQSKKVVLDENYLKDKGKTSHVNSVNNSVAPPHI